MGNCQAIDAAALVIQHPSGKLERLYWPVTASEIMRINPGHYVSIIIPLPVSDHHDMEDHDADKHNNHDQKTVRFTRVKLLRPTDTLALGHAYRLITSQEVMKVLRAKKSAKTKNNSLQSAAQEKQSSRTDQTKGISHRPRTSSTTTTTTNPAAMRPKPWRPSLQSISEAGNSSLSSFT